jgi:hypothetical protein
VSTFYAAFFPANTSAHISTFSMSNSAAIVYTNYAAFITTINATIVATIFGSDFKTFNKQTYRSAIVWSK